MSIYTTDVESKQVEVIASNDGVMVTYSQEVGASSKNGIMIKTPEQAQTFREAVNKAVDILMKNDLKGL